MPPELRRRNLYEKHLTLIRQHVLEGVKEAREHLAEIDGHAMPDACWQHIWEADAALDRLEKDLEGGYAEGER